MSFKRNNSDEHNEDIEIEFKGPYPSFPTAIPCMTDLIHNGEF